MELKFNIPFVIANRAVFSSEPTFFHNHEHIVTSIDFICREDVLNTISEEHWDMIIFDEAHKLSAYEYGERTYKSRRYEAAAQLSKQCEHLLLLTATPHRGRSDTFKRLLQLLDEDVFATADLAAERVKELSDDGNNRFFIRRLKEDMQDWDGNPLYKPRHTRTVAYRLTPEEEDLYNAVTDYLSKRKKEASESNNIHVSLALQVMQRRLVSSIFAIKNTLEKRYKALRSLVDELTKNPDLWKQGKKLAAEMEGVEDIDDYDDLDDEDRDVLDGIMSDPKKFKWFTTAKSPSELRKEADDVEILYNKAKALYDSGVEEQKFQKLKELLKSEQVVDGEKLVIFTEHKDTLSYLENRLKDSGYTIATIHGGKDADERRAAQFEFMGKAQILIATDAAGEGINLQFCRLLINWDIPWNPNRLEQRMGRIHRYGQQKEVMVFNMVADNTREGQVLETLLTKLDNIRDSLGDDRVYDVIQDVFKGVPLDAIIRSVFDGESTEFDDFINSDETAMADQIKAAIKEQNMAISHTKVNYKEAQNLKTFSEERRLQPIYVKLFFKRAFGFLGGEYEEV
ncbi:MAG: DEAD/DEAH box helicase, partial [Fibrobacter sp.]|nr:DEAD/DEAH box helicase [Fibrobacter sp.]